MTAATRLLIEHGGRLEINRLAEAAGCSIGAIYHNYGSKAGVLSTVVGRYNEAVCKLIAPAAVPHGRGLWLEALRDAADATVTFMWNDPLTPVIVQETIRDASAAVETERWLHVHIMTLRAHFAEAQRAGHLAADREPEVLAAGVAGGIHQIMRVFGRRADPPPIATVRREIWGFVARQVEASAADLVNATLSGERA